MLLKQFNFSLMTLFLYTREQDKTKKPFLFHYLLCLRFVSQIRLSVNFEGSFKTLESLKRTLMTMSVNLCRQS